MAKRKTNQSNGEAINKSAAIRDKLKLYPKAPVKEIVSLLAQDNIVVAPNLVYLIKAKQRRKVVKQRRQRVTAATGIANPIDVIVKAKSLARDVGGMEKLRQLVDALAE
jgi:hypothetical protein